MNISMWKTYEESKQRFQRKDMIKKGGSDSEVMICFSSKFKVSAGLTVIEIYNGFGIYLTSLLSLTHIFVLLIQ